MADIAKVSSENLILVRKNNSNPFEKYMPYVKTDEATGKRTWYIAEKNTNIEAPAEIPSNEQVTAFHDACMWYIMLGNGILQGVYSECQAFLANKNFSIGSGMIMFGGRLIEIGKNSQVNVDLSSFNDQTTVYIKLQMIIAENDTESDVGIYATTNSSEKTDCLNGPETYEIILFKITGTRVEKIIPTLEPGVAQNSTNLLGTGRIAGVPFGNVFKQENGKVVGVNYATEADVCAEARGFEGGDKNRVNENLYLPGRGVYLLQEAVLIKSKNVTIKSKNAGGNSIYFPFDNSNSLSSLQGIDSVVISTDSFTHICQNAGAILQSACQSINNSDYKPAKIYWNSSNDKLEERSQAKGQIEIDPKNKQLRFIGNQSTNDLTYNNLTIKAYLYGGY